MPLPLGTGEDEHRSPLRGLLLDQCCLQPCHHMPISAAQLQLQLKTTETIFCASQGTAWPQIIPWPTHAPSVMVCSRYLGAHPQVTREGGVCCCILLHSTGRPLIFSGGEARKRQVLNAQSSLKLLTASFPVIQISAASGNIKRKQNNSPRNESRWGHFQNMTVMTKYSYYSSSVVILGM